MMEAAPGAANNLDCIVTSTRLDEKASAPPDADDIAKLWIDIGLGDALTAEHVHSIPIGKPRDFFRTHPDSAYRARAEIYVQKSENVIGEQLSDRTVDAGADRRSTTLHPCVRCRSHWRPPAVANHAARNLGLTTTISNPTSHCVYARPRITAGAEGIAAACFQYGHCPTAIDKSRSR